MRKMLQRIQRPPLLSYSFCQVPNHDLSEYTLLRQRLVNFPYSRLNEKLYKKSLKNQGSDFLSATLIQHSIAFAAIKQHQPNLLKDYSRVLFQHEADLQTANLTGADIFVRYFNSKLPDIEKVLKSSKNEEEVAYNLKILFYLHQLQTPRPNFSSLGLPLIEKSGTLGQKAYLLQLYSQQPNYLSFSQKFYEEFRSAGAGEKKKAAFIILSIPNFKDKLSSTIIAQCIHLLAQDISSTDQWVLFRCLEKIFQTDYLETREFVESCTRHILSQLEESNSVSKMPLLHKILKLRVKLKMDNADLEKYIKENPRKFNSLFFKRKINKEPLLSVICSKDSGRYLPEEVKIQFVNYIIKMMNQFAEADVCDSDEIIDNVKLSLKFFGNFSPTNRETIGRILEERLFPMYRHEREVAFWLFLLLCRINSEAISKGPVREFAFDLLEFYDKKYKADSSELEKSRSLEQITEIQYQLYRKDIQLNSKRMLDYDYKYLYSFQPIIYACMFLKKSGLTKTEKFTVLRRMLPKLMDFFQQNKVNNMKNIFIIMGAVDASRCQQSIADKSFSYIYSALEQGILKNLQFSRSCPTPSELRFIKQFFLKDGEAQQPDSQEPKRNYHRNLIKFLDECLSDPQNFRKNLLEYQNKVGVKKNYSKSFSSKNKPQSN